MIFVWTIAGSYVVMKVHRRAVDFVTEKPTSMNNPKQFFVLRSGSFRPTLGR